jgi:hypothetical protein
MVNVAAWVLKYVFNTKISEKNIVFNKVDLEQFYKQNKAQDEETRN